MKRLLLILTILISSIVSSQSFDFNCGPIPFPLSYNDIDFDSESGTVTDTIDQIANLFFEDAGLDKNDYYVDIKYIVLADNVGGSAFLCTGTYYGKPWIKVSINKNKWSSYFDTDLKKMFLMYHELGHAVLKLLHTCTRDEIMTTEDPNDCTPACLFNNCGWDYYPVADEEEFLNARTRMFEGVGQTYKDCSTLKGSAIIEDIFPN